VAQRNVESSFGLSIILRDGPQAVGHDRHHGQHLRPQPWPRRFGHHPFARWHQPGHRQMQRFRFHDGRHVFRFDDGDRHGFFTPGPRHGKGMRAPWSHDGRGFRNDWRHDRRAFSHDFRRGGFMDGPRRSDRHRHHDR
jgi:hypothetical protein